MLASFSDTEKDDVGRHVTRVNQALSNELDRMHSTLTDWARPGQPISLERLSSLLDEQGAAVTPQGRSGTVDLLANLDLNVFFFTDASDKIIWGRGYDEEGEKITLVPKSLRERLTPDSPLLRNSDQTSGLRGMVVLPEGPMMVVSVGVQNQKGDGSIEDGSMIMGKYLDDAEINRLAGLTSCPSRCTG